MPRHQLLYFHAPCFDGLVSGAIVWDYLKATREWKRVRPRGVNYGARSYWGRLRPKASFAVVDFLFHPQAAFWADHHATTFITPESRQIYERHRSDTFIYDPSEPSCSQLIWDHLNRSHGYQNPRFAQMVEWATKIDAARYSSVDEVFDSTSPALIINRALGQFDDPRACEPILRHLTHKELDELASMPVIKKHANRALRLAADGFKRFERGAHLVDDIVVFDVDGRNTVINRYSPYRVFPTARYSAGIIRKNDGIRITAMRNPWKEFESAPLGRIFEQVGGGGHQRVATVVLKSDRAAEAPRVLEAVLSSIRQHDRQSHKAP
jgi:hypothetical protein